MGRQKGDRMPKINFTYVTILLKTRLKMPHFVDMNISTDLNQIMKGTWVDILRIMKKAYTSGSRP